MLRPCAGWAWKKDLEWSESSLEDLAALDKGIARRL